MRSFTFKPLMSLVRLNLLAFVILGITHIGLADKAAPTRIDISSQPDGAVVMVDGKTRGVTPLSLFDLKAGVHHFHLSSSGWRDTDEFVTIVEGDFIQKNFALDRAYGLVLIRTEPADATVTLNGVNLGVTPLLLTTLVAGEVHTLELSRNGYRTIRMTVSPDGRIPIVRDEKLVLDSGVLVCSTEPAGATVLVNGLERGVTPCTVSPVSKGNAIVTFRMAGYEDDVRELYFTPGDRQTLHRPLRAKDAKLTVLTFPEGGMVYVDDGYQGKAPVTVTPLKPGSRKILVKMFGHAPIERVIEVPNGGEMTEEFRLDNILGRIELTTMSGARISLDGKTVGTTRSRSGDKKSDVFAIEKIDEGEHRLLVHLDGYRDVSRKVMVKPKATVTLNIRLARLFIPDTEVETIHRVVRGMLVSNGPDGVTLETSPGVEQVFKPSEVRRVTPISNP